MKDNKFQDPREVAKNMPFIDMNRILRYADRHFRQDLETLYELGEDMGTKYKCDKTGQTFELHAVVPNKFLFDDYGNLTRIPNAASVIGRKENEDGTWEPVHQPVPVLWISKRPNAQGDYSIVKFPEAVHRSRGLDKVERFFEPLVARHTREVLKEGRGFDFNRVATVALVMAFAPERRDELLLGRPAKISPRVMGKLKRKFGHAVAA